MVRGKKPLKEKNKQDEIESCFWTEVTFKCPIRGIVTEKVKVKRLKPKETPVLAQNYELEILKEVEIDDE